MKSHEEDYYQCKVCAKKLKGQRGLKEHEKLHISPPIMSPHECPHCDKAYSREDTLKKHINVNHQEGVERPKCDKCQKI